jgi:hypothetical protein
MTTPQAWSKYRKLDFDKNEHIGAMRCGGRIRRGQRNVACNRPSLMVSTCEGIGGRTVLCMECYLKEVWPQLAIDLKIK